MSTVGDPSFTVGLMGAKPTAESAGQEPPPANDDLPLPPLLRRLLLTLHDAPTLSRYVGHLVLGALLLLLVGDILPNELSLPSIQPPALAVSAPVGKSVPANDRVNESGNNVRHLQRGVVPFTARSIRDVLPMAEPKRTVRTSVFVYHVQSGDSVLSIAQKFGLEGNSLLWANEKLADNPDFLRIGQELYILPIDGAYHSVVNGETVESIAARYKVDPKVITSYGGNHLESPYVLQPEQKLIIPSGIKPYVPRRVFAYDGLPPEGAKKGTGHFAWPMSGYITQRFWEGHRAIDIGSPLGTPIVASDSGFVAIAQWSDVGYGRMIIIDHGNGYQTLYAHLSAFFVEAGQSVAKGQDIGKCGVTGNSTGPHLHFEIIKQGVRRNPLIYLP